MDSTDNSCDRILTVAQKEITPCIEIINPLQQRILIVDEEMRDAQTIVLFSVSQLGKIDGDPKSPSFSGKCEIEAFVQHNLQNDELTPIDEAFFLRDDDESLPTDPTDNIGVLLICDMDLDQLYSVNYVMIDPTM